MMLDRYYGNIRGLVRKHSFLERDYKRESARVLRSDLGASSKYMAQAKPTIQKNNYILREASLEDEEKKEPLMHLLEAKVSDDIKSPKYERLFDNLVEDEKIQQIIVNKSKEILRLQSETNGERCFVIGIKSGHLEETDAPKVGSYIEYSQEMVDLVNREEVISVHNHSLSKYPSRVDLNNLFFSKNIKYGVIICNNGEVIICTRPNSEVLSGVIPDIVKNTSIALQKEGRYNKSNHYREVEKYLSDFYDCRIERRSIHDKEEEKNRYVIDDTELNNKYEDELVDWFNKLTPEQQEDEYINAKKRLVVMKDKIKQQASLK